MVTSKRLLCDGLKQGPGLAMIRKSVNKAIKGVDPQPIIYTFSNGYRDFPIEVTGLEVVKGSGPDLIINVIGRTDYRDTEHPNHPSSRVVVQNYSPHSRTGDGILFLN